MCASLIRPRPRGEEGNSSYLLPLSHRHVATTTEHNRAGSMRAVLVIWFFKIRTTFTIVNSKKDIWSVLTKVFQFKILPISVQGCSRLPQSCFVSYWYQYCCFMMGLQVMINTLRPRQNDHHFVADIFKCIFFNGILRILISMSLEFLTKGPIYNIPAWRRPGHKPSSEPMVVSLLTHKCISRPQSVRELR